LGNGGCGPEQGDDTEPKEVQASKL
jgi:hypothetical protein